MNNDSSSETSPLNRRRFLGAAAGATLGAGALLAASQVAQADPAPSTLQGLLNVKAFGAKGDGTTDDAPAIQSVIDLLTTRKGGIVWFPPGMYLIGSPLTVTKQVTLWGSGWGTPPGAQSVPPTTPQDIDTDGSKLYVKDTSFVPITFQGSGSMMRDLAIYHKQPIPATGWTPAPYPTAILVNADDVRLENIFLFNPTVGITSQNAGRLTVSRVFGQPLLTGISIDVAEDVVKLDNIHFWPFWAYDAPVQAYMNANAVAIASYRNDNPHFSNIFSFFYAIGILFGESSSGITSKFHVVNVDHDSCAIGVYVSGPGTTGQLVNYTYQGPDTLPSTVGVFAQADGVLMQLMNIRTTKSQANGIRAEGNGTMMIINNVWVEAWDQSGRGFPGIEAATTSATVQIGFNRYFSSGTSIYTGGVGTVSLGS